MHSFMLQRIEGIEVNTKSYTAAIMACGNGGNWQMALSLLEEMDQYGVLISDFTYNACISACEKSGKWEIALELLEEMISLGIEPGTITYSACISACARDFRVDVALDLFQSMKNKMIPTNTIVYSALIDICAQCERRSVAIELYEEAYAMGEKDHWVSQGGLCIDLHHHSRFSAGVAVEVALKELQGPSGLWVKRDPGIESVKIVVGKGLQSEVKFKSVVRPEVERVLREGTLLTL